eukprot:403353994
MSRYNDYIAPLRSARLSSLNDDLDFNLRDLVSPVRNYRENSNSRVSYLPQNVNSAQREESNRPRLHLLSVGLSTNQKRKFTGTSSDEDNDQNNSELNEIDHSSQLCQDFSKFLFLDQLSDIKLKVRKSSGCFESLRNTLASHNTNQNNFIEISAHRIVLSARCPYFHSKFCRDWSDQHQSVAHFEDFYENAMKEILKYLYTGKLKVDISNIMGVLKIASFLGLDQLTQSCRQYLINGYFNAFDLCILYCEVREENQDFDEMRKFLSKIIPPKVDNEILCRVLKEIWQSNSSRKESYLSNEKPVKRKLSLEEIKEEVVCDELKSNAVIDNDSLIIPSDIQLTHRSKNSEEIKKNLFLNEDNEVLNNSIDQDDLEEDSRDLQEILFDRLQKVLPEILEREQTKQDFLSLPKDLLLQLVRSDQTLLSETLLFQLIEEKLVQFKTKDDSSSESLTTLQQKSLEELEVDFKKKFFKCLLQHIRLPLINSKILLTSIKSSGHFDDQSIFEALQFQLAKEILNKSELRLLPKYQYRGLKDTFDMHHQEIKVINTENMTRIIKENMAAPLAESGAYSLNFSSAVMSQPLPLHGIHYFEISINRLSQTQTPMRQVQIGLCSLNENISLSDVHRSKNSVILNCFDSQFWSNGQQLQVFSNRFVKIKSPLEAKDVIRIAIDFRQAKKYQNIWKDNNLETQSRAGNVHDNLSVERTDRDRNSSPIRNSGRRTVGQFNLRERLRDSLRYRNSNLNSNRGNDYSNIGNLNMIFNANNELVFFNSPCKFHYAFNNSEFHEGVDLNLMNGPKDSPLHMVIGILETSTEVTVSKHVYFDEWEAIPKEPFLLNCMQQQETILETKID